MTEKQEELYFEFQKVGTKIVLINDIQNVHKMNSFDYIYIYIYFALHFK